jgi:hypothetical protein
MSKITVSKEEYLRLVRLDATVDLIKEFDQRYGNSFSKEDIMKLLNMEENKDA